MTVMNDAKKRRDYYEFWSAFEEIESWIKAEHPNLYQAEESIIDFAKQMGLKEFEYPRYKIKLTDENMFSEESISASITYSKKINDYLLRIQETIEQMYKLRAEVKN